MPDGDEGWGDQMVRRLGLESTLRPQGRPRETAKQFLTPFLAYHLVRFYALITVLEDRHGVAQKDRRTGEGNDLWPYSKAKLGGSMMPKKKLAVLIIHGMGAQESDYAKDMIDELKRHLKSFGKNPNSVAWQTVWWANVTEPRQRKYIDQARRTNDLDFMRLRRFIVSALGDAAAYRRVDSMDNTTYKEIHNTIDSAMNNLYEKQLDKRPVPLVVIAHSLGAHIVSNYIWDHQNPTTNSGLRPFQRMEYLAGMITFGCNIPLFTFAYKTPRPIRFPGRALSKKIRGKAKWLNFFDPDDVLGYPLKPLSDKYKKVVNKDVAINVGGVLANWNPMSHSGYWTDNDFTKPVSKFLTTLI